MSNRSVLSRRDVVKYLGGVPMLLPLGALASSALASNSLFSGSALAAGSAAIKSAKFIAMDAPSLANTAAMATTSVGSALEVTFSDDSKHSYKLAYQPFFMTGDMVPNGKGGKVLAGGCVDINNKPVMDRSVLGKERQVFSNSPDGTSLLSLANANVPGIKGKAVFAVVQFEYTSRDQGNTNTYGVIPSPIAVLTLDQDQATGKLTLVKYHNVDTSKAHGIWICCGASLSPWNTHLASEEYEPDAQTASANKQFLAFSKNLYGDETKANPYHYGHLPEVTVHPDGTGTVKKHYNLGRISHELIEVMPDNRTALMGDDYTNGGFFMFVADRERDLSSGTLYVARLSPGFSVDPKEEGPRISWIKLGHATSAEIEKMANTLKPSDIMTTSTTDPNDPSYVKMFLDGNPNWVKLKPGMEKAAAFLETHRYANLLGASMAFTKMEGTTVNKKDKIAYSALQNIQDSMVKGGKGWTETSGIALEKPLRAGGVFAHKLFGGQLDTAMDPIRSEWVPVQTRALLVGEDIASDALGNLSNPDKIGNPDNLKFSEKMRTLFIGEDSGSHVNNFLWAYNVDTKQLSRIASMPVGAKSTGLHAVDEINGWTYIMSNFQHPGDWIPALHGKVQSAVESAINANYKDRFGAAVGYLTADPTAIKIAKA